MSDAGFKMMTFSFRIRDFFKPRRNILREIEIREGFHVLDFGCGSGSYVKLAATRVGKSGRLYALDVNPLAVEYVKKIAARNKLANVETIFSGCTTGLPDGSVDVVLLYDTFHDLTNSDCVLKELHRILKTDGVLSFSDHHMKQDEIMSKMTEGGFFRLLRKGEKTYSFASAAKV
jgi:ubiquinone/menaquinone biosynthesis C-methylase UbiE